MSYEIFGNTLIQKPSFIRGVLHFFPLLLELVTFSEALWLGRGFRTWGPQRSLGYPAFGVRPRLPAVGTGLAFRFPLQSSAGDGVPVGQPTLLTSLCPSRVPRSPLGQKVSAPEPLLLASGGGFPFSLGQAGPREEFSPLSPGHLPSNLQA